jgi:thioredoxin-like negative regulator of GroEL
MSKFVFSVFALMSMMVVVSAQAIAGDAISTAAISNSTNATTSAQNATISTNTAVTNAPGTYAAAYDDTQTSGKPLVVLVGASWCPACQSMKTSIMPAVAAQGGLANIAFAHVNVDAQRNLASQLLEGSMIPQLVMYEKVGDGWKMSRLVGSQSVEAVQGFIGPAVARQQVASKQDANGKQPVATKQPATQKPGSMQQSSTSTQPSTITSSAAAG